MKRSNAAREVPRPIPPPEINAKFKDRLPIIMSEICDQLLVIEPAVSRLTVQLREFLDYLDFEITKVDLSIKQMQWESKADPGQLKATEEWLQTLRDLKTDFQIDVMTSPPETLRSMVDRIQKTFGVL
jgi:hypothetical protein